MRHPNVATREQSGLLVVDLQEPFLKAVAGGEAVVGAARLLIQAASILDIPVLATTQYGERLGSVVPAVAELLTQEPLDKMAFSCCGAPAVVDAITKSHRRIWVICGVESHICVCQTAHDLLHRGYRVHVVADGVSSRTPQNREIGLQRVAASGGVVTSAEAVIYEWLGEAGTAEFREILKLVR